MITVRVDAPSNPYDVLVGPGARHELAAVLPHGVAKVAVVTQHGLPELGIVVDPGVESTTIELPQGEHAKTLATVEEVCRRFAAWGLTRADAVVCVGGGVVSDAGGFAAASYHRGVPVVHVATTLLAQVDAAIGGKTGVNLPEGKNLVGAFWQPAAVICDTDLLTTLPEREHRSGLGEMAKYHFIGGERLDDLSLPERIAASIRIKAAFVSADEREDARLTLGQRSRAVLNYGHTLAHALETAGSYDLRHGEAVAVGLVFAAELAAELGRIGPGRVDEHRRVVAEYGLPDRLPDGADPGALVELMTHDKKAVDGLVFVLDGSAGVEPVRGVPRRAIDAALERIR